LTPEISNTEGRKGRWRGAFVWLSFPIVLLLVWPWTWNCYFSIKIYDSLFWVLPALLLILSTGWFAVFMRISSKRNFEARALGSSGKRSIGRALYYSAFFGLVFGSVTLMPIDLCALSMVYATSRTSVRFSSPISVRKNSVGGGRSCVYYLICRISRNGPTRFPLIGPTLGGLPAEPQATSFTRPFCAKQVS
jgi:hypothetical protein